MESAADVEKMQDIIRQLEVQNQKLRSRGTPNRTKPNATSNNNDSLLIGSCNLYLKIKQYSKIRGHSRRVDFERGRGEPKQFHLSVVA